MNIRLAKEEDIREICQIYDLARAYMRKEGNFAQWKTSPNENDARQDLIKSELYVVEEEEILAVFTFFIGEEKNYKEIDGAWRREDSYGVIHRIASSGKKAGITRTCFSFCLDKIPYLRIDTHEKNRSMQEALKHFGFQYCGIVHVEDGSPRLAFDYIRE